MKTLNLRSQLHGSAIAMYEIIIAHKRKQSDCNAESISSE